MRRVFNQEEALKIMMQRKIEKADWLKNVQKRMMEICDYILESSEDWLDKKDGTTARKIGGKAGALYTAFLQTGEERYLKKALEIYQEAISRDFTYYYGINNHLSVGDAVLALTMCYNFLYDYLDEKQKERSEEMLTILADWLYTTDSTWGLPQKSVTSCNHNCVHYGALGLCGLILENELWLEKGLERVKDFLKHAVDETGYVTEGLSYLNYGNMTAILFCESYHQVFGEELYHMPGTVNQVIAHMLPTPGMVLKLNDHGKSVENMLPQVYLANRYKRPDALYLINEYETAIGQYFSDWNMDMSGGFVYPFIYIFTDETMEPQKPSVWGTPKTQIFEAGRIMARTAWDDPMSFHVSVSCGHCFHYGHNHADKGAFTIYGMGEEFLIDIGALSNEDRAHNILMINGIGQPNGRSRGEIREVRDTEEFLYVSCDTTRSYKYTQKTLIGMAFRTVLFMKKPFPFLVIRDDVQLERPLEEAQLYEFMMHTAKGNQLQISDGKVEIIGQNYGNRCCLNFLYPTHVETKISDENRVNLSYGKEIYSKDLSEEAIASCHTYNPYLTTVIVFANEREEYPKLHWVGDAQNLVVDVEKDGQSKQVEISRYQMRILK